MRLNLRYTIFLTVLILVFLGITKNTANAQTGTIIGNVHEISSGDPLPGANIYFPGTNIGATTDINGDFYLTGAPLGSQQIRVTYVGFRDLILDVEVRQEESLILSIEMEPSALAGDTVVVTAQASAQMQAINQQLSSKNIKNVVSSKQIQELPEANAAEAVGRLPGVSLERNGGEGTKVVIRGMSPKYSLIQIDGVNMTATGSGDRSTDLSMISPYMLEGIELTKSVMANQEATATGGIVNFRIKKAPELPTINLITQGGYNGLRNTYQDFKISLGGSNRFFRHNFGVYAQVDYEEKDAGSQQLGGINFYQENPEKPIETRSIQLMDIFRNVKRLGGALVLDYTLPTTDIKLTNFYSRINREEIRYQNNYEFAQQDFQLNYTDTPESWLTILTNSLQIDHFWRQWQLSAIFSHSFSENILPGRISTNASWPDIAGDPFLTERKSGYNANLDPETIPYLLTSSISDASDFMSLGGIDHDESNTQERDIAAELNMSYKLNISNLLNIKLGFGGKYRHKNKQYDNESYSIGGEYYLDLAYNTFENELSDRTKASFAANDQFLYLESFLDKNYNTGDFLNGKYRFSPVMDKDKFRLMDNLAMATFNPANAYSLWDLVLRNYIDSNYSDFHGKEDYHAFYLMPEINITSKLLLIPGVRYEYNRTEYTGYRGNRLGVLRDWTHTPIDTVTKVRENEFFLPMIQAFYTPLKWLTIKAGYTQTLQRPNYDNIMPGWVINSQGSIWNLSNFRLKPEVSINWDIQFSVHSEKIGLFSAGAFHKTITDMIFWTGQRVITDTAFYELPTIMNRQRAASAVNNPYTVYNYGFEFEWQSNFWYLPGLLKGLVVNVNYTRNKSEARYPRTVVRLEVDPETYKTKLVNEDTTYKAPMISQPDHVLNFVLGYDYRGFSFRTSMRYSSHIFKNADWYEALRGYSTDFIRFDLAIRQKLPVDGLEFFLNVNNLTNEVERDIINHMNFTKYMEDYGRNANIGLRYQF